MKEIKSVQLFANPTAKSETIKKQLLEELSKNKLKFVRMRIYALRLVEMVVSYI